MIYKPNNLRNGRMKQNTWLVILILISFLPCMAQDATVSGSMNSAAQYHLGKKDEVMMNVNIWGYVKKPGQYVVPRNTDLVSLISFAGGPVEGASMNNVRIVRAGQLLLASIDDKNYTGQQSAVPILEVQLKNYLKAGEVGKIPLIQAGDTVIIPQTTGNKVKNVLGFQGLFGVLMATASLILIVDRIGK
jgi:hypothetical protein